MGRLEGRIAIITGAARGMGAATAELFVVEGARVVLTDVLEAEGRALASRLGPAALFVRHDVREEGDWQQVTARAREQFGGIDILVNNAAVLAAQPLLDMSQNDFRRVIDINLIGTFLGLKVAGRELVARRKGAIVNISSIDGMKGANGLGAYNASKWAVRGLTKTAALEFGPRGVRVNSVHPGGVYTAMANPTGAPLEHVNKDYSQVPLQRIGMPEEIARATLWLASDEASYVNGAELLVDGGWVAGQYLTMLPGHPGDTSYGMGS
jgi:3alpha(or 20beta)-hydroxysteroid dehydrogenase